MRLTNTAQVAEDADFEHPKSSRAAPPAAEAQTLQRDSVQTNALALSSTCPKTRSGFTPVWQNSKEATQANTK
jgi:hypothetical protein